MSHTLQDRASQKITGLLVYCVRPKHLVLPLYSSISLSVCLTARPVGIIVTVIVNATPQEQTQGGGDGSADEFCEWVNNT